MIISFNCVAECRPLIEQDLVKRITSQRKLAKAGKIASGAAFVTVGGFYGTMGVILLGPLWAGAVVGSTFGALAVLPVGATFIIISKVKKNKIKNLGRTLSIIGKGPELARLHEKLLINHPELSMDKLIVEIKGLNSSKALCDGTVSRFDTKLRSKQRIMATPKDIYGFLDANLSSINPSISLVN